MSCCGKLRDKGNTVIVVEHDPDVIKVADHIVDVGPHAGSAGGQIVFEGSYADLLHADTLTGRFLQQLAADQRARADGDGPPADPARPRQQPAERQRRHPDGRADASSPAWRAPAKAR